MLTDFLIYTSLGGAITAGLGAQAMTTTSSISDGGNPGEEAVATTLATIYTTGLSIGASKLVDIDKIKEKLVQDSFSYVESMNEEELNRLEEVLLAKTIEFENSPKEEQEKPKIYTK